MEAFIYVMIGQLPPFALSSPEFRFKALAAHAGRAALGGDREVALACFAVARLAAGILPPFMLSPGDMASRVANTKQWLASLTLPNQARTAAAHAIDSIGGNDRPAVVAALSSMLEVAVAQLDQASTAEMHELMGALSG